jgi:1-acyl-sn-glycerol-3-phosphate acyltransferase
VTIASSAILAAIAWLLWAGAAHALTYRSPRPHDINVALAMLFARVHARVMQRVRVEGRENVPAMREPGPLVVVANHTSGLDPMLIQTVCPFEIKWMMAKDMQHPRFAWLWELADVISVSRVEVAGENGGTIHRGNDSAAARVAIKHLKSGGVVGVYPEGRIAPPGRIVAFAPGVGLLVSRGAARVLQVVIEGTARTESISAALLVPARARLRFLPMRDYAGMSAGEISRDLELRLIAETGWRVESEREEGGETRSLAQSRGDAES